MNTHEAYKILELNNNATSEEINNAFRKLAKKYHPDRNKDNPEAEAKFKEINSAYQLLNNPQQEQSFGHNGNVDLNDIFSQVFGGGRHPFNPFQSQNKAPDSISYVTLTFAESVLGVEKELNVTQNILCKDCNGDGFIKETADCTLCHGKGSKTASFSRGNMQFIEPCFMCRQTGKQVKDCKSCVNHSGYTSSTINAKIKIPGGVQNGNVLRIPGSLLKITVNSDPDMEFDGTNVFSNIEISLLDALRGVSKPVRTVKGEMNLKIPPNIKNGNSVQVHGYGVNGQGSHIFNVSVKYPEDKIEKLIKVLEE